MLYLCGRRRFGYNVLRILMPDKDPWQDLCDEAIEQQDFEKLLVVIEEIERRITEKEPREKPIPPK